MAPACQIVTTGLRAGCRACACDQSTRWSCCRSGALFSAPLDHDARVVKEVAPLDRRADDDAIHDRREPCPSAAQTLEAIVQRLAPLPPEQSALADELH